MLETAYASEHAEAYTTNAFLELYSYRRLFYYMLRPRSIYFKQRFKHCQKSALDSLRKGQSRLALVTMRECDGDGGWQKVNFFTFSKLMVFIYSSLLLVLKGFEFIGEGLKTRKVCIKDVKV